MQKIGKGWIIFFNQDFEGNIVFRPMENNSGREINTT